MKICLGCNRSMKRVGFRSVDLDGSPDIRDDVFQLRSVEENSCDVIVASHVLEHGPYKGMAHERVAQVTDVLRMWYSKLKHGGEIYIAVPDFDFTVEYYMRNRQNFWSGIDMIGPLFGGGSNDYDQHRMIFTRTLLQIVMHEAGFIYTQMMSLGDPAFIPEFNGASRDHRGFNMKGIK